MSSKWWTDLKTPKKRYSTRPGCTTKTKKTTGTRPLTLYLCLTFILHHLLVYVCLFFYAQRPGMWAEVAWKRTRVRGWKPAPLSGALRAPPKHQKPASLPPGEGGGRTRRAGQGPPLPGPFHVCFSMKPKVSVAAAGLSARCHAGRPAGSSDVGEPRARPRLQGLGQMNILQGLGLGPMASVIGRTAKVVRI